MLQVVPKTITALGYNTFGLTQWQGVLDGIAALTDTTPVYASAMITAGTIESLTLRDLSGLRLGTTLTVYLNGAPTALTVSLAAGAAGREVTAIASVPFAVGDWVQYRFDNTSLNPPFGDNVGVSITLDVPEQIFGISQFNGFPSGFMVGGAFGNGVFTEWTGFPMTDMGGTYSISGINGTIDRIGVKRVASTIFTGGYGVALILNGVIQNGSGGTVNTVFIINDTDPDIFILPITLPIVQGDHVSMIATRFGPSLGDALVGMVGVTPTTPGEFMLCGGGFNSDPSISVDSYQWNTFGGPTDFNYAAPIGPTPIELTGFYGERGAVFGTYSPGVGASIVYTLMVDGVATTLQATQADNATFAIASPTVASYPAGSRASIQVSNFNTPQPSGGLFHWGVAARAVIIPPPPECPGVVTHPRTDGLPYSPAEPPPCLGDGEVTHPRTGA